MNILAADTSSKEVAVAVVKNGKCLNEVYVKADRNHSAVMLGVIMNCLKKTKLKVSDIDVFASTLGPGSFTGIRVGMATLKGFAQPLGRKFYGKTVLDVMANSVIACNLIWAVIDAGRNEVYAAKYAKVKGNMVLLGKYFLIEKVKLLIKMKKNETVVTLKSDNLTDLFNMQKKQISVNELEHVDMQVLASMAARDVKNISKKELFTIAPVYIRPSEAESTLKRKLKEKRMNEKKEVI